MIFCEISSNLILDGLSCFLYGLLLLCVYYCDGVEYNAGIIQGNELSQWEAKEHYKVIPHWMIPYLECSSVFKCIDTSSCDAVIYPITLAHGLVERCTLDRDSVSKINFFSQITTDICLSYWYLIIINLSMRFNCISNDHCYIISLMPMMISHLLDAHSNLTSNCHIKHKMGVK